jgi:hypothetical protein
MTALANGLKIIAQLFVDDGALAIAIVAVVALSAVVATLTPGRAIIAGVLLLNGCLVVLFCNVMSTVRKHRRPS